MSPFVRPLPLEIPLKYREIANAVNAYNICLSLEQKLNGDEDVERNKQNLVYCRVLGYLIQYAPREEVVASVAADIVSCENDQDIFHLGKMFFKFHGKFKSSHSSDYLPNPSLRTTAGMIEAMLRQPWKWAVPKNEAMIRDNFRCVISGSIEYYAAFKVPELEEAALALKCLTPVAPTVCTHIIPTTINTHTATVSDKNVWHILKQFGYTTLSKELNSYKIHRLENVMTLTVSQEANFIYWYLWLVPTDEPNTYKAKSVLYSLIANLSDVVFTTPDEEEYPVPKREYLELHAMCAEVAHLSGAFEYIKAFLKLDDDDYDTSSDESSPDPLG